MDTARSLPLLLLLFLPLTWAKGMYNYDYMDMNCSDSGPARLIDLSTRPTSYGFVRPTARGGYQRMDCSVTLKAPPEHHLIVRFRKIEIYKPTSAGCTQDFLTVAGNSSAPYTYCGYSTPSYALISTTDIIRLRFHSTSNLDSNSRIGFDLYYTSFHTGACHTSGETASEFRCKRERRCVPRELVCDRLDNCGDWSDERSATCGLSTGMIVVISLISVLVGGTCVLSITMYMCAKKKESRARSARSNEVGPVEYVRGEGRSTAAADPPPPYTLSAPGGGAPGGPDEKQGLPPAYESPAPPYDSPASAYDNAALVYVSPASAYDNAAFAGPPTLPAPTLPTLPAPTLPTLPAPTPPTDETNRPSES